MEREPIPADWDCEVTHNIGTFAGYTQYEEYGSGYDKIVVRTIYIDETETSHDTFCYVCGEYVIGGEGQGRQDHSMIIQCLSIHSRRVPIVNPFILRGDTPGKYADTARERGVAFYPIWKNRDYFYRISELEVFKRQPLSINGNKTFAVVNHSLQEQSISFDWNTLTFGLDLDENKSPEEKMSGFVNSILTLHNGNTSEIQDQVLQKFIVTFFPGINELYQTVNNILPLPISEEILPHLLVI